MNKRYGIEDLRNEIANKTKKEKILAIKQSLNNYKLNLQSIGHSQIVQAYEPNFDEEVKTLLKEVENDDSYKYTRDWNWYFNADHIPNQKAIFATKDFLEKYRANEFEALEFFNILFKQKDELKDHLDKPIDFISSLHQLPLSDIQKHTLFGMLLYWHGGYPVDNLNAHFDTILKLIEKDFLSMFPDNLTPEKEFCATSVEQTKILREAEAHVQAVLKTQFNFTESKYLKHLSIDFEDLPQYVVQRGIIWRFENQHFQKDSDYVEWQSKLIEFLKTIPSQYIIKTLQKGIEYAKKAYSYHLHNECSHPDNCVLNQSWERRIAITQQLVNELVSQAQDNSENKEDNSERNKAFTTARQVLAVHYLLKQQGLNSVDSPSAVAKFIQFLTGREVNTNRIQDTTIYKKVCSPFSLNDKTLKKDLEFIVPYFKQMGLTEIVKELEEEIAKC